MSVVTIHLVRHGDVENPDEIRYGRLPGFRLSSHGRAQALETGRWLSKLDPAPSLIVTSPLERAVETAELLVASQPHPVALRHDARLLEVASPLEGLPRRMAPSDLARAVLTLGRGGHESPLTLARRMGEVIAEVASERPSGSVVFVSHQAPLWVVRLALEHGFGSAEAPFWVRLAPWTLRRPSRPGAALSFELDQGRARLVGRFVPRQR